MNPIATKTFSLNTTLVPGPGAPSIIANIQSIGKTNGIDSLILINMVIFLEIIEKILKHLI